MFYLKEGRLFQVSPIPCHALRIRAHRGATVKAKCGINAFQYPKSPKKACHCDLSCGVRNACILSMMLSGITQVVADSRIGHSSEVSISSSGIIELAKPVPLHVAATLLAKIAMPPAG